MRCGFEEDLMAVFNDYHNENQRIRKDVESFRKNIQELPKVIADSHNTFEKDSELTEKDAIFIGFTSLIQILRHKLVNLYFSKRLSDQESANSTIGHNEEHSNRTARYYASREEILTNPVPFDAIRKEEGLAGEVRLSGYNHRFKAVGHDPVLGWLFGTANIMTNTITIARGNFVYDTYHVHTGIASNGVSEYNIDKICERADTGEMLSHFVKRVTGENGYADLAIALGKEEVHLLSDLRTKQSLPLPILSSINPHFSHVLQEFGGVDSFNLMGVGVDIAFTRLINYIVGMIHANCYNSKTDGSKEAYYARTMKVIMTSGAISSGESLFETILRAYEGDSKALMSFDIGGTYVTLENLLTMPQAILEIRGKYVTSVAEDYIRNC